MWPSHRVAGAGGKRGCVGDAGRGVALSRGLSMLPGCMCVLGGAVYFGGPRETEAVEMVGCWKRQEGTPNG